MYRLIKNLHYPTSKFFTSGNSLNKIDTFFKINKKTFFKKTNFLMKKDYYKTLGVSPSSDPNDIKKAYFKLAKEWHPDVNKSPNAKEKFSEISEAYDTLGDANKKKSYDNTGMTGDQQDQYNQYYGQSGMGGGFNPFGGGSGSGFGGMNEDQFWEGLDDFFGGGKKDKNKKGRDVIVNLDITFMDAIQGTQKTVQFDRISVCSTCNGSKCKPGSAPTQCSTCGGSGQVFYKQGFMSVNMMCSACNGEGSMIRNPCMTCYGKGYTNISVKESINVPKGVDDNMNLRLQKKGHYAANGQHGDLYVKIKIKPHTYFKREQFDIYTTNFISVTQAVLGGKLKVKTLYGEVQVNVDPGTNDGDTKKLLNYGITKLAPNQNQKGHHYIKFKILVPSKLNETQKKLYEELAKVEDKIVQNYGD